MYRRKHSINSVQHYPWFQSKMMGAFIHEGNQPWIPFSHHDPVCFLTLLIGRGEGRIPPQCSWPMAGITTSLHFTYMHYFFNLFIFNWRIIALPCSLVSAICQHELAIGVHMSALEPPSHLPPFPPSLGCYKPQFEFPGSYSKFPLAILQTVLYTLPCHSLHSSHPLLPPPLPMSLSLFSVSAYPLLPWKYVHQYRLSGFHV